MLPEYLNGYGTTTQINKLLGFRVNSDLWIKVVNTQHLKPIQFCGIDYWNLHDSIKAIHDVCERDRKKYEAICSKRHDNRSRYIADKNAKRVVSARQALDNLVAGIPDDCPLKQKESKDEQF